VNCYDRTRGLRIHGRLDDAYGKDEKPTPSVRDARLRDVDEQFLLKLDRGVLYRIRR